MRGAFCLNPHQLPFVPSSAAKRRVSRGCAASPSRHPERSEGIQCQPLKPRERALARVPDPPDALAKFFACGELLLATAPKVTKRAAPESAPSHRKRRSAMRGSPALLGRGGLHPQAIPGLWMKASASCLARVCARLIHLRPCGARRRQTGRKNVKSEQHLVIPAKANPGGFRLLRYPPFANPLPKLGERGRGKRDAFDVAVLLTFLPVWLRRAPQARGDMGSRLFGARRGRTPKRFQTGQGRPVCKPPREREAQGTPHRAMRGVASGAALLWLLSCRCRQESDPPVGGNPHLNQQANGQRASA